VRAPEFTAIFRSEIRTAVARELTSLKRALERLRREVRRARRARGRAAARGTKGRPGRAGAARQAAPSLPPRDIRSLRTRLKLTRAGLARLVGVSPASVFFWEKGRSSPRGKNLSKLRALMRRSAPARGGRS
jgi:DNA-binding transcriptional regulator YiaG